MKIRRGIPSAVLGAVLALALLTILSSMPIAVDRPLAKASLGMEQEPRPAQAQPKAVAKASEPSPFASLGGLSPFALASLAGVLAYTILERRLSK